MYEYKGEVRFCMRLEHVANVVARSAQYESANGWDLVSFSVVADSRDSVVNPSHIINAVFRRELPK